MRSLLKTVAQDPFAHSILTRVDKCPFGPGGKGASGNTGVGVDVREHPSLYDTKTKESCEYPFRVLANRVGNFGTDIAMLQ